MLRTCPIPLHRPSNLPQQVIPPIYPLPILKRIFISLQVTIPVAIFAALFSYAVSKRTIDMTAPFMVLAMVLFVTLMSSFVSPGGRNLTFGFAYLRRGERYLADGYIDSAVADFNKSITCFRSVSSWNLAAVAAGLSPFEKWAYCCLKKGASDQALVVAEKSLEYWHHCQLKGDGPTEVLLFALLTLAEADLFPIEKVTNIVAAFESLPQSKLIWHVGIASLALDCGNLVLAGQMLSKIESLVTKLPIRPISNYGAMLDKASRGKLEEHLLVRTACISLKARFYIEGNQLTHARLVLKQHLMVLRLEKWANPDSERLVHALRMIVWHCGLLALAELNSGEVVALSPSSAATGLLYYLAEQKVPPGSDIFIGIGIAFCQKMFELDVERVWTADENHNREEKFEVDTSITLDNLYLSDDQILYSPIDQRKVAEWGFCYWNETSLPTFTEAASTLGDFQPTQLWNQYFKALLSIICDVDEETVSEAALAKFIENCPSKGEHQRIWWNVVMLLPQLEKRNYVGRVLAKSLPKCVLKNDRVLEFQWKHLLLFSEYNVSRKIISSSLEYIQEANLRGIPENMNAVAMELMSQIYSGQTSDAASSLQSYIKMCVEIESVSMGIVPSISFRITQKELLCSEVLESSWSKSNGLLASELMLEAKYSSFVQLIGKYGKHPN